MNEKERQESWDLFKQALREACTERMEDLLAACPDAEVPALERDGTGTPVCPGHPKLCLGSGAFAPMFECCCDECDHYLKCFPGWAPGGSAWKE